MKIVEYQRPSSIEDAVRLLERTEPLTIPMGGGTWINLNKGGPVAVVDLQDLELTKIEQKGKWIEVGAGVKLQDVFTNSMVPSALRKAISIEVSYNSRHQGTMIGLMLSAGGRSLVNSVLLALDVKCVVQPGGETMAFGDLLPLHSKILTGKLVSAVQVPVNVIAAFDYVARTPIDQPILIASVAKWSGGRTRVVIGGYGKTPLVVLDGAEDSGAGEAARDGYHEAGDDWASAEYRRDIIPVLVQRCIDEVAS